MTWSWSSQELKIVETALASSSLVESPRRELIPDIPALRAFIASGGLSDATPIGVTAGASTPEHVVRDAMAVLLE